MEVRLQVFERGFQRPAFAVEVSHLLGRHLARHIRQDGPNIEKVLYTATCAGLRPDRHFYHYSGGNFAENGLWHVLTEAPGSGVGLQSGFPNLSQNELLWQSAGGWRLMTASLY